MSNQDFVRSLPSSGFATPSHLLSKYVDPLLLTTLIAIVAFGFIVLYSALDRNTAVFTNQVLRMGLGFAALLIAAQLAPRFYLRWTPVVYVIGIGLLLAVLLVGVKVKGSQRWLEFPGILRFQPSELM